MMSAAPIVRAGLINVSVSPLPCRFPSYSSNTITLVECAVNAAPAFFANTRKPRGAIKLPAGNVYDKPLTCQPPKSNAAFEEVLNNSTYSASGINGWYMISLMTTGAVSGGGGPLLITVTMLLAPDTRLPRLS